MSAENIILLISHLQYYMYFYVQFTLNLSYNGIEIMINPDSSDMIDNNMTLVKHAWKCMCSMRM